MQIVIPMSGYGQRFLDRGYNRPKYMLEILNGRSVIELLVSTFPKDIDILFILNDIDFESAEIVQKLASLSSKSRIVSIRAHREGPVRTLLEASSHIRLDQEVIVSYCDYIPVWDYHKMMANARNLSADCCVATYRGYHPHHKDDGDRYGYCRAHQDSMEVVDYKEKSSFTRSPQQENASCGLYYFKNGSLLLDSSANLASSQRRINGEMYVSMLAMELLSNNKKVIVEDIMFMLQLGTPDDYEGVKYIVDSILSLSRDEPQPAHPLLSLPCVLPMAGRGSRFAKKGITTPKQFLPILNSTTSILSLKNLPISETHLGVLSRDEAEAKALFPEFSSVTIINDVLNGQALTCQSILANGSIEGPFMITPCDSALTFDPMKLDSLLNHSAWDVIVMTCKPNPATLHNKESYSWVLYDSENCVKEVLCKRFPKKNDLTKFAYGHIDGTFFFRSAQLYENLLSDLLARGPQSPLSEYYVDELIDIALSKGAKIFNMEAKSYICFGTPSDYNQLCYYYSALVSLGAVKK